MNGTTEWPVDPRYPRSDANPFPSYGVSWDRRNGKGRSSNRWASKEDAERVYQEKLAAGLKPEKRVQFIAGFAL